MEIKEKRKGWEVYLVWTGVLGSFLATMLYEALYRQFSGEVDDSYYNWMIASFVTIGFLSLIWLLLKKSYGIK